MIRLTPSDDRRPADHVHLAILFFGLIIGAAGVIVLHPMVPLCGVLMVSWSLLYYSVQAQDY